MPSHSGPHVTNDAVDEMDLLAGLWQEAAFPRLPPDAPPQLDEFLEEIDNPRRIYSIHRAVRRHDFQHLVDRYIVQLREGCGDADCSMSTCFTCRLRITGKKPVRKYNATSARTLAVYLASRDNPLQGLCPSLRQARPHRRTPTSFIYSRSGSSPTSTVITKPRAPKQIVINQSSSTEGGDRKGSTSPRQTRVRIATSPPGKGPDLEHGGEEEVEAQATQPRAVYIAEKPVNRDYRSFSATTFSTMAFKMLEWLMPHNIEDIAERVSVMTDTQLSKPQRDTTGEPQKPSADGTATSMEAAPERIGHHPTSPSTPHDQPPPMSSFVSAQRPRKESAARRGSTATRRPSTKLSRKKSGDHLPPTLIQDDDAFRFRPKSPATPGSPPEKALWQHRPGTSTIPRGVPEAPARPAFFEKVTTPIVSPRLHLNYESHKMGRQSSVDDTEYEQREHDRRARDIKTTEVTVETTTAQEEEVAAETLDYPAPQTLCRISVDLVDFICDVFTADRTAEPMTKIFDPTPMVPQPDRHRSYLSRVDGAKSESRRKQWKTFNEQAIFTVLSNPFSLLASFTKDNQLYDSHTLWYCMLRLTRVVPSLVFHSLWISAGSLFNPPSLPENYSGQSKSKRLSDVEAGRLMSICLHALVAAAPITADSRSLYEMSRVRSHGLALAGEGLAAKQSVSTCLEYDDAFSNDLALRLARRLFCALNVRRMFAEIANDGGRRTGTPELDVLRPLLDQLDVMEGSSERILEFPPSERLLHESRVPTLLLDWARAVLLQEWDGEPTFSRDSAFAGALEFLAVMYENRNVLLLGDIQFRVDHFSERLDPVEMPVAWLNFKPTSRHGHIMEYPYIFSPEALVSFFRSINFSRMSRMFEESSSLKTRMGAIVDPESLITNPHHKVVLQDLLKTASAKYMILEIGRQNVLRDAFDQLWRREQRELLRPLKVHLGEDGGEEGFDSGGVQQEFFRLAIAECLDPDYGAFTTDDRTRMAWFVPGSLVELWKFELIGLLVSLAVFNGLTLPITFPRALYRKLLGEPAEELHHIADGWPELASGLSQLLEWDEKDGSVEDIFARTYEFSVPHLGMDVSREMGAKTPHWPQGLVSPDDAYGEDEAPSVTNDNRDEFVSDYIKYLTDVSVRPQYEAFERGFKSCLESKALRLLNPAILQSVVEGVQEIDIFELRRYARYVGWDSSHHTIKDFWSIVKRYDDNMKRKLLEFVTASDRVPVGGMRNLQFVVQKNGEEEGSGGHLPTAYTCYGTLLLPEYRDKEVLRERLNMALENAQGFGFA